MSIIRKQIIDMIEDNTDSKIIMATLLLKNTYEDMFMELKEDGEELVGNIVTYKEDEMSTSEWVLSALSLLKKKIDSNNEFFKDISKHDIISSRQHFQNLHVSLSNELYHLKKNFEQIENDKRDLQLKLVKARDCLKCYGCKDDTCINNIYHKPID
jgi:uncharacterized membrane-anchored protein YjiN (DUF445 family)